MKRREFVASVLAAGSPCRPGHTRPTTTSRSQGLMPTPWSPSDRGRRRSRPPGLPIINDPTGRVCRGLDPSLLPEDRLELVHFAKPGRYLVICGFLFHFQDNMFGTSE